MSLDDRFKKYTPQGEQNSHLRIVRKNNQSSERCEMAQENSRALAILRELTDQNVPINDWFFELVASDINR